MKINILLPHNFRFTHTPLPLSFLEYDICMSEAAGNKIDISQYKELIETISKVEFKKFSSLGLIEFSEVVNVGNYTIYYLLKNAKSDTFFNNAYLSNAIKWAIRNEVRRRYKWYLLKNQENTAPHYTPILSIDDVTENETPIVLKDTSASPETYAQMAEVRQYIETAIEELPEKEREIIKAKFFYNKKLKDISAEFNLSQSRISRIIQYSLEKIKKELLKQECE